MGDFVSANLISCDPDLLFTVIKEGMGFFSTRLEMKGRDPNHIQVLGSWFQEADSINALPVTGLEEPTGSLCFVEFLSLVI